MPRFVLLIFCCLSAYFALAQDVAPKRELRAVWVSTVLNLDYPSRKGLTYEKQREEFRRLLDEHVEHGMNAVIVQIRPSADAFYFSQNEPWSEWLTGEQGRGPKPFYDPLSFMIEEARKRHLEFHAWFNPFRAVFNTNSTELAENHVVHKKPEWFLQYGVQKIFNPGIPEVRDYLTGVITDVLMRYDIDAVHLDDYFYPYPKKEDGVLNDSLTFRTYADTLISYSNSNDSLAHWRRNNINLFIKQLSEEIKDIKPYVKFGISPFGVWRNRKDDPEGSDTEAGMTCYDHLYADTRLWLEKGWLDYIAPQIYFSIGYELVAFEKLLDWWRDNTFGRHLYVGHAAYKVGNNHDKRWDKPEQLPEQLRSVREIGHGSMFFRAKHFSDNPLGFTDSLKVNLYRLPAFPPVMPWLDDIPPLPPEDLRATGFSGGVILHWKAPSSPFDSEFETVKKYVVYRFEKGEIPVTKNPARIIGMIAGDQTFFIDPHVRIRNRYVYVITAVDRLHNESGRSLPAQIKYRKRFRKY